MFRTLFWVLVCGVVASGIAYAAVTGFGGRDDRTVALSPPQSPYHLDGVVTIDPDTTQIDARWVIQLDQPGTDTLTYWLNETLETITVSGPGVASYSIEPEGGPPGVTAVVIELLPASEGPRQIDLAYSGVLLPEPMDNEINSISPELVEFTVDSFWQPFDTRFDQRVTGHVELNLPGDWTPVSPGQTRVHDGGVAVTFPRPTLDFPITLLTQFREASTDRYRVLDTRPGELDLTAFADMVGFCAEYLDTRFGELESLPQASIVIHQRASSGYARGTLIALTDIGESFTDSTQRFICHELTHFWASNGNAGTVENWINEAFAEYIGIMAVRERRGAGAFTAQIQQLERRMADLGDLPSIWTPDDLSRRPHGVNYIKGPLALAALEARIGEPAFAELARRMMVDRLATTPEMLDALGDIAGPDHRAWFEARLAQ